VFVVGGFIVNARMCLLMLLIGLMVCLVGGAAGAERDRMGYYKPLDHFFELLAEGKTADAVASLYATNPHSDKFSDSIEQVKVQLTAAVSTLGEYRGYELLLDREVGNHYVYIYALAIYDRQPLAMEFHLYRPKDKWIILNYSFTGDVKGDLETFAQYDLPQ
jgi:hypothetical protein